MSGVFSEEEASIVPLGSMEVDRSDYLESIHRDIYMLREMMEDLKGMVDAQDLALEKAGSGILMAADSVHSAGESLNDSASLNAGSAFLSVLMFTAAGTAVGCGVGGSLAVFIGVKPAVSAFVGAGFGFFLSLVKR